MIPVLATRNVLEIDANGTIIKDSYIDAGAFSVTELENDFLLLPCGDQHCFIIVDRPTGKTMRQIEDKDIQGATLLFVAQILQLPNGNLLICNWDGHSKGDTSHVPQLIEINSNNEVVWTFTDKEKVGKVSAAHYIKE